MFDPRPAQADVLSYTGGKMGVIAVPGSGKTLTLSRLAAKLITGRTLKPGQEVLVVTLVNAAVDNITRHISAFLTENDERAFRVRTLHGLTHDILRARPTLVGLPEDFQIVDEREAEGLLDRAAEAWVRRNPGALDRYLNPSLTGEQRDWVRRAWYPELVEGVARSFIRYAKDRRMTPGALLERQQALDTRPPLVEMGLGVYADYQRGLASRGAIDFDDLVRLALEALELDAQFLRRLRRRWPFILEDEAQDSSRLQEEILRTLAGPDGNWVRVGDPNQAIFETFTTADPESLLAFRQEADHWQALPNSGRAAPPLIELANHLIEWTRQSHPLEAARTALVPPLTRPTPPDDPQQNPDSAAAEIRLVRKAFSPMEEIQFVMDSLESWMPAHPEDTVAILVPTNQRGFEVVDALRNLKRDPVDSLLRSTNLTRLTAGALGNLLRFLTRPHSPRWLATAFRVWQREAREDPEAWAANQRTAARLRECAHVEEYIWPYAGRDWLEDTGLAEQAPETHRQLKTYREKVQRWQQAGSLPIDQLILTLAQDLFSKPTELAIAHKLALLLQEAQDAHPQWTLDELTEELRVIARNERRFLGFAEDEHGFDPERHRGRVVVSTLHKAKGLEWDRVYLLSVNDDHFPSGSPEDTYVPEKWFLQDGLNLEAEALAQLSAVLRGDPGSYEEGAASQAARVAYVRERLRLLFVGITRARRDLIATWNTGARGNSKPALPFLALAQAAEEK